MKHNLKKVGIFDQKIIEVANIFLIHKSNIKINSFLIETITEKVILVKKWLKTTKIRFLNPKSNKNVPKYSKINKKEKNN